MSLLALEVGHISGGKTMKHIVFLGHDFTHNMEINQQNP